MASGLLRCDTFTSGSSIEKLLSFSDYPNIIIVIPDTDTITSNSTIAMPSISIYRQQWKIVVEKNSTYKIYYLN